MPTRTRPTDRLAHLGQDTSPAPSVPTEPPGPAEEPGGDGLRLVAVPDGWPPYDCETHGAACPAADPGGGRQPAGQAGSGRQAAWSAGAEAANQARVVTADETWGGAADGAGGGGAAAGGGGYLDQVPGPSAAWCGQFAQVLVEVLAGYRPAKQLARATTEQVRAQIALLSRAASEGPRPRIRRVMTSRPDAGVVELTTVVSFGARSRAVAMRFEHIPARPPSPGRPGRPARWLCTEIETS